MKIVGLWWRATALGEWCTTGQRPGMATECLNFLKDLEWNDTCRSVQLLCSKDNKNTLLDLLWYYWIQHSVFLKYLYGTAVLSVANDHCYREGSISLLKKDLNPDLWTSLGTILQWLYEVRVALESEPLPKIKSNSPGDVARKWISNMKMYLKAPFSSVIH